MLTRCSHLQPLPCAHQPPDDVSHALRCKGMAAVNERHCCMVVEGGRGAGLKAELEVAKGGGGWGEGGRGEIGD